MQAAAGTTPRGAEGAGCVMDPAHGPARCQPRWTAAPEQSGRHPRPLPPCPPEGAGGGGGWSWGGAMQHGGKCLGESAAGSLLVVSNGGRKHRGASATSTASRQELAAAASSHPPSSPGTCSPPPAPPRFSRDASMLCSAPGPGCKTRARFLPLPPGSAPPAAPPPEAARGWPRLALMASHSASSMRRSFWQPSSAGLPTL